MMTQFGRPSKDPAWAALIQHSDSVFENDEEENDQLLFELNSGVMPHGCSLIHNGKEDRPHWRCKFYIGGEQRVIAKGTLFQCAKFYDYALIFFEKYRVKKDAIYNRFNFNKPDDESDMLREPGIAAHLESLEKYLLKFGDLMSPETAKEKRETGRLISKRAWRKKQTGTYQVLERIRENTEELVRLNSEMAACKKQLDEILKLMQVKPT